MLSDESDTLFVDCGHDFLLLKGKIFCLLHLKGKCVLFLYEFGYESVKNHFDAQKKDKNIEKDMIFYYIWVLE